MEGKILTTFKGAFMKANLLPILLLASIILVKNLSSHWVAGKFMMRWSWWHHEPAKSFCPLGGMRYTDSLRGLQVWQSVLLTEIHLMKLSSDSACQDSSFGLQAVCSALFHWTMHLYPAIASEWFLGTVWDMAFLLRKPHSQTVIEQGSKDK